MILLWEMINCYTFRMWVHSMELTAEISQVILHSVLMVNYISKVLLTSWGDVFAAVPGRGGDFASPEHRLCSEMERGS